MDRPSRHVRPVEWIARSKCASDEPEPTARGRAEALRSRLRSLEGPLRLNPSRALRSDLRASALGALT